jgi:hypothetical protein
VEIRDISKLNVAGIQIKNEEFASPKVEGVGVGMHQIGLREGKIENLSAWLYELENGIDC